MALPRAITMKCVFKHLWFDGNTMLMFEPVIGGGEAKGPSGISGYSLSHYGHCRILVSPACAADFTIGNNYTWTAT